MKYIRREEAYSLDDLSDVGPDGHWRDVLSLASQYIPSAFTKVDTGIVYEGKNINLKVDASSDLVTSRATLHQPSTQEPDTYRYT